MGLVTADWNRDGSSDFLVGINDGNVMAFENAPPFPNRTLSVQLRGRAGNSTCIGARVTVTLTDGSKQTTEIDAGGGYLSQSTSVPSFGLGGTDIVANITVRWPDGTVTSAVPSSDSSRMTMRQP